MDNEHKDKEGEDDGTESLRRSSRVAKRPKYLEDYWLIALSAETFLDDVPENYEEIKNRDDRDEWYHAIDAEMKSLLENETWSLEKLPSGKRAIDNKWIFKLKRDVTGKVERYKARLVAKGCSQRKGFDYDETYAPVAGLTTLRLLISIINKKALQAHQMDVKNAFLQGNLKEEIYMKQPKGQIKNFDLVCRLTKSLYGLKQAPRAWNLRFETFIRSLGLMNSESDKCLYIGTDNDVLIYLLLYVDDIIIATNDLQKLLKIKKELAEEFKMKDLGKLHSYLGLKIDIRDDGIFLSQPVYLKNLLERFNMQDSKPAKTPMEVSSLNEEHSGECITKIKPYRELIGCLMYVMLNTRPDLSAAVNYYSRFQENATEAHCEAHCEGW